MYKKVLLLHFYCTSTTKFGNIKDLRHPTINKLKWTTNRTSGCAFLKMLPIGAFLQYNIRYSIYAYYFLCYKMYNFYQMLYCINIVTWQMSSSLETLCIYLAFINTKKTVHFNIINVVLVCCYYSIKLINVIIKV